MLLPCKREPCVRKMSLPRRREPDAPHPPPYFRLLKRLFFFRVFFELNVVITFFKKENFPNESVITVNVQMSLLITACVACRNANGIATVTQTAPNLERRVYLMFSEKYRFCCFFSKQTASACNSLFQNFYWYMKMIIDL